ncbi:hypothetical protein D3C71_929870 [compost metagenome]
MIKLKLAIVFVFDTIQVSIINLLYFIAMNGIFQKKSEIGKQLKFIARQVNIAFPAFLITDQRTVLHRQIHAGCISAFSRIDRPPTANQSLPNGPLRNLTRCIPTRTEYGPLEIDIMFLIDPMIILRK